MLILLKLAWRNLFRNKRRTVVTALSISVGLAALMFCDALVAGWEGVMIDTATGTWLGHGQVHGEGFRDTLSADCVVNDSSGVMDRLREQPEVNLITRRVRTVAMISSAADSQSVVLDGVVPETEKGFSKLDEAIEEGVYLDDDRGVLLGRRLAETLAVGVGDKVVVTVAAARGGSLVQDMFRVKGIFHFGIREMDAGVAVMSLGASQRLLGLGKNEIHELAFTFKKIDQVGLVGDEFWHRLSGEGNVAEKWLELMPEIHSLLEMMDVSMVITTLILFGIVSAGIVNTLFMSLYERMFEFGILRAIGTRPVHLGLLIVFEAGCLALLSCAIGMVVATGFTAYFGVHGIDYSGTEFVSVAINEPIRTVFRPAQFVVYPLVTILFTMIAGIYPGLHAARMTPMKAIRNQI